MISHASGQGRGVHEPEMDKKEGSKNGSLSDSVPSIVRLRTHTIDLSDKVEYVNRYGMEVKAMELGRFRNYEDR